MITLKLYEQHPYLKEFQAKVLDCIKNEEFYEIELDQTCFFPGGGGQSPDRGNIVNFQVTDVFERENKVFHVIDSAIEIGTLIKANIDWDFRYLQMQNHSGEHIISGLIHKLFGYDNIGFHMDDTLVTIDINGKLSSTDLDIIEAKANQIIEDGLDISFSYDDSDKDLKYRIKKDIEKDIRVVSIPNVDSCACCGIHVGNTREISLIKILSSSNHRGGSRINLVCGKSAFKDYSIKHHSVNIISQLLSSKPAEIQVPVEKLLNDINTLREEKQKLLNDFLKFKAQSITPKDIHILFESSLDSYNLGTYGGYILEHTDGIVCIFSGDDQEYKFIITSNSVNCRPTFEKLKDSFEVRGGGKPTSIQGTIFATYQEITHILSK